MEHWLTKCFLYKKFKDQNWEVLTEYFISPHRKPDLLIITDRLAFIVEVETDLKNFKNHKDISVPVYPIKATFDLVLIQEKAETIIDLEKHRILY